MKEHIGRPDSKVSLLHLKEQGNNLAGQIRTFVQAQAPFWQLVPSLALEAYKRTEGINQDLATAFKRKIYPLRAAKEVVYLDLTTGELFESSERGSDFAGIDRSFASPSNILAILMSDPDSLDARALIRKLLKEAQADYPASQDPAAAEEFKKFARERLNIPTPDIKAIEAMLV